jgi:hypothetical protein
MLLAVVAFIALACTALVWANGIWATTLFTAALGVLLFGVLALVLRRGVKQAFWIGFALFGWGYLWMAHWPNGDYSFVSGAFDGGGRQWTLQQGEDDNLATTRLLAHAYSHWLTKVRTPPTPAAPLSTDTYTVQAFEGQSVVVGGGAYGSTAPPAVAKVNLFPHLHEFMRVGHSLFIIVFALFGGWLGTVLYRTRESKEKPPAVTGG